MQKQERTRSPPVSPPSAAEAAVPRPDTARAALPSAVAEADTADAPPRDRRDAESATAAVAAAAAVPQPAGSAPLPTLARSPLADADHATLVATELEVARVKRMLGRQLQEMMAQTSSVAELEEKTETIQKAALEFAIPARQLRRNVSEAQGAMLISAVARGWLARRRAAALRARAKADARRLRVRLNVLHSEEDGEEDGDEDGGGETRSREGTSSSAGRRGGNTIWVRARSKVAEVLKSVELELPAAASDHCGSFMLCRTPASSAHGDRDGGAALTWHRCERAARCRPVHMAQTWEENKVRDGDTFTVFWSWRRVR